MTDADRRRAQARERQRRKREADKRDVTQRLQRDIAHLRDVTLEQLVQARCAAQLAVLQRRFEIQQRTPALAGISIFNDQYDWEDQEKGRQD